MNTNAFDNLPAGDEDEVVLEKARQCIVYGEFGLVFFLVSLAWCFSCGFGLVFFL